MKKGLAIVIVIALIIVWILIFNLQSNKGASSQDGVSSNFPVPGNENVEEMIVDNTAENNIIEITSSGFSPKTLTINQGDSVTFVNKDSNLHWPATAMHPTHTVYPGSDIKKCNTPEQSIIFDACKGLSQGEEYIFTFNEKGGWGYHDHLSASLRGTIVVNWEWVSNISQICVWE